METCLISMPFVTVEAPTLGIPLLQSILKKKTLIARLSILQNYLKLPAQQKYIA